MPRKFPMPDIIYTPSKLYIRNNSRNRGADYMVIYWNIYTVDKGQMAPSSTSFLQFRRRVLKSACVAHRIAYTRGHG